MSTMLRLILARLSRNSHTRIHGEDGDDITVFVVDGRIRRSVKSIVFAVKGDRGGPYPLFGLVNMDSVFAQ